MKLSFTLIALFCSAQVFGQQIAMDTINTTSVLEFRSFMDKICSAESDNAVDVKDSLSKYKVVFSSQGKFIDPKNHLMRLYSIKNIQKENFFAEVLSLKCKIDSLSSYFRTHTCQPIKTCLVNNVWGESIADSMVNIQSTPSFWASCMSVSAIKFSQENLTSAPFNNIHLQNTIETPSIISYIGGKYLIVDLMLVIQIGNQTDSGTITTFYLERID